jgi:hypothetical protein
MPVLSRASPKLLRDLRASLSSSCRSYGLSHWVTGPIDVQRRIARQKGERLARRARRARSHGGFSAINQSLNAGFKPRFTEVKEIAEAQVR